MSTIGWTVSEEAAFAQIMAAGGIERLPAIRLYRRCRCNLAKALQIATDNRVPAGRAAGWAKANTTRANKALIPVGNDTQLTLTL